jgi:hypothetical protein
MERAGLAEVSPATLFLIWMRRRDYCREIAKRRTGSKRPKKKKWLQEEFVISFEHRGAAIPRATWAPNKSTTMRTFLFATVKFARMIHIRPSPRV